MQAVPWVGALLLAGVGLGLWAGCDSGTSEPEVIRRAGTLLPLATGNTWTYERRAGSGGEPQTLRLRFGEAVAFSGRTNYPLQVDAGDGFEAQNEFFADSTASGDYVGLLSIVRPTPEQTERQFFLKPSTDTRQTYTYVDRARGLEFDITVQPDTVEVPAGRFFVYRYTGYDADPEIGASLAPGIGIVRLQETGGTTVLTDFTLGE
jgi:hypothetical protein